MGKEELQEKYLFMEVDYIRKSRFSFIDNETLQANLAINYQYSVFLMSLVEAEELPGPIEYSIYKNIIIYAASIVEGSLSYTLQELIRTKKIITSEHLKPTLEYKYVKKLHKIDEHMTVCGAIERKIDQTIDSSSQFVALNKLAKKSKVFLDHEFEKADKIRKRRNKIHLAGLEDVDDQYDTKDVKEIWHDTNYLIQHMAKKLNRHFRKRIK